MPVWKSDGDWLFGKANRNLTTIEAPWKQDGLSPSAKVLLIALANSRRSRGASHQPTFMRSCLTTSHTCLSCLPSRWVRPCFLCLHMIGLTGVLLLFFSHGESGISSMGGSPCFREWVWNSQIKLYCVASEKWNSSRVSLQESDIRYTIFYVNHIKQMSVV